MGTARAPQRLSGRVAVAGRVSQRAIGCNIVRVQLVFFVGANNGVYGGVSYPVVARYASVASTKFR
jgi:hypothetical protein